MLKSNYFKLILYLNKDQIYFKNNHNDKEVLKEVFRKSGMYFRKLSERQADFYEAD